MTRWSDETPDHCFGCGYEFADDDSVSWMPSLRFPHHAPEPYCETCAEPMAVDALLDMFFEHPLFEREDTQAKEAA